MRSILFAMAMLCTSLLQAAQPASSLYASMKMAPGVAGNVDFSYLGGKQADEYKNEIFFLRNDRPVASFSRTLPAVTQIILLNNIPVLVNAGEEVKMSLSPVYKQSAIQPGIFHPVFTGKNASRQALPYVIDSLFNSIDVKEVGSMQQLDEMMTANSQLIAKLINKINLTASKDLSLLKVFEQYKQLLTRSSFGLAHPELTRSAAFHDWYSGNFDIGADGLSGIGSKAITGQIVNLWWEGRKMHDSTLTSTDWMTEVLQKVKGDLMKSDLAIGWMVIEGRINGFSSVFKSTYPLMKNSLLPGTAAIKTIDSLYHSYQQLERGNPAFDFALMNDQGNIVHLSDFKGKTVIIDAWAMWCTGCVASLPEYRRIRDSYKDKDDIVFLTISWDSGDEGTKEQWKKFSKSHNIDGPNNLYLSLDRSDPQTKQMCERYCLTGITRWIAIDKNGNMLNGNLGYPDSEGFAQKVNDCYMTKN